MKILIVIPARGGSKGIPKKNIRLMNGEPLIAYSIKNALCVKDKYDVDVVVDTDDNEIAKMDWLNKKMFDFRGLIPRSRAIEVTKEELDNLRRQWN